MRQTWEEIGLDLAESAYTPVGQLDDREVTTSLGKRLLMVLSPFVFLQLAPYTTPVDPAPGTALHWVPLAELLPLPSSTRTRRPRWSHVTVDASSRLAPRHSNVLRLLMRVLVGSMQFPAILISPSTSAATPLAHSPSSDTKSQLLAIDEKRATLEHGADSEDELKLWGLSLGMTLDLLLHMTVPNVALATGSGKGKAKVRGKSEEAVMSAHALLPPDAETLEMLRMPVVAPSLTSIFPRFSYPDVNFWIWCAFILHHIGSVLIVGCRVFGKRYRAVMRGWEASVRAGGTNDRRYVSGASAVGTQADFLCCRINWTGSALTTFYAAVRKALVVVLVLRAIGVLVGLLVGAWILFW